jgi:hypothetical protein
VAFLYVTRKALKLTAIPTPVLQRLNKTADERGGC